MIKIEDTKELMNYCIIKFTNVLDRLDNDRILMDNGDVLEYKLETYEQETVS